MSDHDRDELLNHISGGIWKPLDVPEVFFRGGGLVRVTDPKHPGRTGIHMVGYVHNEGRVSSPLKDFYIDGDTIHATSRSGRHYAVTGFLAREMGNLNRDAAYVLGLSKKAWGLSEEAKYEFLTQEDIVTIIKDQQNDMRSGSGS